MVSDQPVYGKSRHGGPLWVLVGTGTTVGRVALRRLMLAVPLILIVSGLSFVLVSLAPGNAALEILGFEAITQPETYERLQEELGLNHPLHERYWHWLVQALHGDLGNSVLSGEPVTRSITNRLPVTISLVVGSLLVMTIVGVGLGIFSTVRGGVTSRVVDALALVGFAVPGFWLGSILISFFAVSLPWLPAVGYVPFTDSPGRWLESLILPIATLSIGGLAIIAKQTREAMLDALASEHIRMAWANGIPAHAIYLVYAFKNAAMRVVTILGLNVVGLLGGTILVENIFGLPGLGTIAVSSAQQHDIPVIQGVTVLFTLIIVAVNLVVDLAYTALDPRVRVQ